MPIGAFKLNSIAKGNALGIPGGGTYDDYLMYSGGNSSYTPPFTLYGLTGAAGTILSTSVTLPSPWGQDADEWTWHPSGNWALQYINTSAPTYKIWQRTGNKLQFVKYISLGSATGMISLSFNAAGTHLVGMGYNDTSIYHYSVSGYTFTQLTNIGSFTARSGSSSNIKQSRNGNVALTAYDASTATMGIFVYTTSDYTTYTGVTGLPTMTSASNVCWNPRNERILAIQTGYPTSTVRIYYINSSNAAVLVGTTTSTTSALVMEWDPTGVYLALHSGGNPITVFKLPTIIPPSLSYTMTVPTAYSANAPGFAWNYNGTQLVIGNSTTTDSPTLYTRSADTFTREAALPVPGNFYPKMSFSKTPSTPTAIVSSLTLVAQSSNATATNLPLPTGSQAGDIVIYGCARSTSTGMSAPTGWTQITAGNGSISIQEMWCYKVLVAADITAGSISHTGSTTSIISKWAIGYRPNIAITEIFVNQQTNVYSSSSGTNTNAAAVVPATNPIPCAIEINSCVKTNATYTTQGTWTGSTTATTAVTNSSIVFENITSSASTLTKTRSACSWATASAFVNQQFWVMVR